MPTSTSIWIKCKLGLLFISCKRCYLWGALSTVLFQLWCISGFGTELYNRSILVLLCCSLTLYGVWGWERCVRVRSLRNSLSSLSGIILFFRSWSENNMTSAVLRAPFWAQWSRLIRVFIVLVLYSTLKWVFRNVSWSVVEFAKRYGGTICYFPHLILQEHSGRVNRKSSSFSKRKFLSLKCHQPSARLHAYLDRSLSLSLFLSY